MYIGLDIGATRIRGVALEHKRIIAQVSSTPKNLPAFKRELVELIDVLSAGKKIQAIGLGIAGNISPDKIRSSANIEYLKNFGLKKFLADRYKAKVALDNDANCFLRAELAFGQASKRDSALAVTLGSGLGGALAYRGEIITGAHNGAGEIGHIPFGRTELEDYASAKFLKKSGNNYRALGQNLSQGLVTAIRLFNPEIIIIGGGIVSEIKTAKIILAAVNKELDKFLKNEPIRRTSVKITKLGDFAGALGALEMVRV